MTTNPWRTLDSRTIYTNSWLRLREDSVIRPDGKEGIYSVVEMRPSVGVAALNRDGQIALVTQWRYAHNKISTEIPTGGSLPDDGNAEEAARRELREETGLVGGKWRDLGPIDNSNGATTDVAHIFVATDLTESEREEDAEESIVVSWMAFADAVEAVLEGFITESVSVAAILKVELLRLRGELAV